MNPPLHHLQLVAEGAAKHSAKVTDWSGRILWTGICLAFVALLYVLMWRAWKRRARRQGGEYPAPAPIPTRPEDTGTPLLPPAEGRYFGTTGTHGWLDRVVAHGLGARSAATLTLTDRGLAVDRTGAPGFFVPAADLTGARIEKAHAGKVMPEGGLIVIGWNLDGHPLESGFRAARAADHDAWVDAVTRAADGEPPAATAQHHQNHQNHQKHQNHQNHQEGTVK